MKTYITTPIYYVNDKAHIGHAYTTIIADTYARFKRLQNDEVFFLTGTDEHGQKIQESAKKNNTSPKEYADKISNEFKQLWKNLEISNDYFIRTTDEEHKECVKKIFLKMYEKGDIYKSEYEGHYCVSCESFYTKTQLLENNKCPDCKKDTRILKEESYFFRLSKYEKDLLNWYKQNPNSIFPTSKKNEVIAFVEQGLKDLSISRTSFDWGIKVPLNDDKEHVIYVWLDALSNYLSALGYLENEEKMPFWQNAIHFVGKDILKFHAIYWPAFLMSLDLPLPKCVAAHGWWLINGEKMSKSIGNVINPLDIVNEFSNDALRYYLLSYMPFGNDGDYSKHLMVEKINSELVNEFGNLVSRTISMAKKYFNLKLSFKDKIYEEEKEAKEFFNLSIKAIEELKFNDYLSNIFKAVKIANSMISKYEPWALIKTNQNEVESLLISILNIIKNACILLSPVLINSTNKLAKALNIEIKYDLLNTFIKEFSLNECEHLFSRVELKEEKMLEEKTQKQEEKAQNEHITIDDFAKIKMQIAQVISCENVEGSEKLLKFELDLGNEKRQVLSGIAKNYNPKDLVGKQIVLLSNLKARTIFKHLSEGMILSAKNQDESLVLLSPLTPCDNGSIIG